jgi:type II secretory pathway pseudopilin PulG
MPVRESASNEGKAGSAARRPSGGRTGGGPPARGADPAAGDEGGKSTASKLGSWGFATVLTVVLIVGVGIALSAVVKAYTRAEQRADAENQVQLTHIAISRAQQQALITRAQIKATQADADKRVAEAVGIRRAQNEISQTLTGHYLQYEAIQAQKAVATSGRNNTLIYIPSGGNGVPLVQDPQNVNRLRPTPGR